MESRELRSRTMRAVKSKDTAPEMIVRRLLHSAGFRYRLHRTDLPGCPDLAFPGRRKVIFVHGCFWHGHTCTRGSRVPKANREYWRKKIAGNSKRGKRSARALRQAGWKSLVVWECQLRSERLLRRLTDFLLG